MDTVEFLARVLPERGIYVVAYLSGGYIKHQVCSTIEETAQVAQSYSNNGFDVWHACAAYREPFVIGQKDGHEIRQLRVHRNVRAVKSFWMDLDVEAGNPKKYESQNAALDGLMAFCSETKLPLPMIVSSGYGLHIYWTLDHEIIPEVWRPVADRLKVLATTLGLKADPACTSDPARILRPIGTANRKVPAVPRWVELIADGSDISIHEFEKIVQGNLQDRGVAAPVARAVRAVVRPDEVLNAEFTIKREFPPCSALKVADRCAQMRMVRDDAATLTEPHWYAGIQLMCHAIEGDGLIHEWSSRHGSYSQAETNQKIQQVRSQSLGPTVCTTFETRNPGGCDGCPFKGKISSPAQLGTHVAAAPAPVINVEINAVVTQVTLPEPPSGFTRGLNGGIYYEDPDGITHKIYEHDFYPTELAHDEMLGYETTRWRHHLPQEGWKEFLTRSSLLARPVEFECALRDNHIQPLIRNKMAQYGDAYLRQLKDKTKMRQLFKSQGWKERGLDTCAEFVLGDKLYREGEIVQAGFSHGTEKFLTPFKSKGSLAQWKALTWVFQHTQFAPHAFMLLLAFAAPLLKLSGRQGFTVCALGDTGIGKSTMARFMTSVFGTPEGSWVVRTDSELTVYQRMGAHGNLPVYMDESTTIKGEELRDLVYSVPGGKSRNTMKADYTLRQGAEWSTIFVTSSNDSLQGKLQIEKQNAEAESMRLFEFKFPRVPDFGPISKMIPAVLDSNYGVAGAAFIQHLVNNRVAVKARLTTIVEEAEREFGMEDKERFWSQAVALTLYGGELARQWGIIDFDPQVIKPWLQAETRSMRSNLADTVVSPVSILGEYLNEFVGQRLTVTALNHGMQIVDANHVRELSQRYEKDKNLLYISRKHLKFHLQKRHVNTNNLRDELIMSGVLLNADCRRTLGAGTDMTGSPVPCWCIRADHPELVGVV